MAAMGQESLTQIKETLCYVVADYEEALRDAEESHECEKTYQLPDG